MRLVAFSLSCALLATAAHAEDKKKGDPKANSAVDAFFDPPPAKKSALDDLQKATEAVSHKDKKDGGMAPKGIAVDEEAKINLHAVFAAEKIVSDKKLGCQPAGREKKKLTYWVFDELPETGVPFQVCLNLSSKAGREMSMSVAVVDPRNLRVVKAEDVVDFRGRTGRIDHVLEFPAPLFKTPGQYVYLVEMDGKEVGRLPLFEVRVGTDPAASTPAAPTP